MFYNINGVYYVLGVFTQENIDAIENRIIDESNKEMIRIVLIISAFILAAIILLVFLSMWASRKFTKPIYEIISSVDNISKYDLTHDDFKEYNSEFTDLSQNLKNINDTFSFIDLLSRLSGSISIL